MSYSFQFMFYALPIHSLWPKKFTKNAKSKDISMLSIFVKNYTFTSSPKLIGKGGTAQIPSTNKGGSK